LVQSEASILKIESLSVSYGNIRAITQVSLEVQLSETVAIIGANGSGKSTLLAAVIGIQHPDSGTILFNGNNITGRPTESIVASGISLIPEGRGVLTTMTVEENLLLGAYHVKGDITKRLDQTFQLFPVLRERRKSPAGTLSGGQQQILSIGRALMASPKLLMMDEPSLGLAPLMIKELFDLIAELKKEGQTILLAEQNARKALQCADRAYVFESGRVLMQGTSQELVNNPKVRQAYMGGID
jgi:branched-chain amino acid transport system ATP-binding protein